MSVEDLREKYERYKEEGALLAGDLYDIPRRVALFLHLHADSGGNHPFMLIAAHGALWASGYFEAGGSLGRLIAKRYFYNAEEKAFRLGILQEFAEAFRRVNRQVCVDTYANYVFAREHGRDAGAEEVLRPELLDALNRVHAARSSGRSLSSGELREVFERSFRCEQEETVAPGVQAAVSAFECRIMKFLCLRPIVRFAYFPPFRYMVFRDFSSKEERIARGLRAFELALSRGWEEVRKSLRDYGAMPLRMLEDPASAVAEVKASLVRSAALVRDWKV